MTELPPIPQTPDEARAIALDRRWPLEVRTAAWSIYRRASRQKRADEPQKVMTKEKR